MFYVTAIVELWRLMGVLTYRVRFYRHPKIELHKELTQALEALVLTSPGIKIVLE